MRDEVTTDLRESGSMAITSSYETVELRWSDATGPHTTVLERRMQVGSSRQLDLVIADPTVSRLHAELELRDDGLWVRDLGSRNGTWIGAVRVECARVPEGSALRMGSTDLSVRPSAQPGKIDLWPYDRFGGLLGRSEPMREMFTRLSRVATLDSAVLLHGETGTGKELIARAIHDASPRAKKPYVVVDCAALPEGLLESELFGHARGAFTGAATAREGAIPAAHGGTVFLDEIGELPLAVQPKLLRVLETRVVRRLGENATHAVDVRFVSATHRDLRRMVNEGSFREDLYFRLAVLPLRVPPLRERLDDLPMLVEHFLRASNRKDAPDPFASRAVMLDLAARPWLGNVRELRNFIERAVALGADEALRMDAPASASPASLPPAPAFLRADLAYRDAREHSLEVFERAYFAELLRAHQRNVSAVAAVAGVERTYVYRFIRKHGL